MGESGGRVGDGWMDGWTDILARGSVLGFRFRFKFGVWVVVMVVVVVLQSNVSSTRESQTLKCILRPFTQTLIM